MGQTQMKELLRDAWKEVFQVEDVADDTDFFEVGGDSVMAVQLSVLLAQKGVKLDLADIFTASTFGKIAEKLIETEAIHIPDSLMKEGSAALNEEIPDKWRCGASKIYENETGESISGAKHNNTSTEQAIATATTDTTSNASADATANPAVGNSPSTPEDVLANILGELIPNFDKNEDLFAQGLTSYDAVNMVSKCEAAGYSIELKDVYMHSTFDELLEVLKK